MKPEEFFVLANPIANEQKNVRLYSNWKLTGVSKVPNEISSEFGKVIRFLQELIEQGFLCQKDQHLLIYNFQPAGLEGLDFYNIDMVIKPLSEIENISDNKGVSYSLALYKDGTITNEAQALINGSEILMSMGLSVEAMIQQQKEKPKTFGNYKNESQALRDMRFSLEAITQDIANLGGPSASEGPASFEEPIKEPKIFRKHKKNAIKETPRRENSSKKPAST